MRYTGRGKRRSRVFPVLTLAAAVAAVILLTVVAKGVVLWPRRRVWPARIAGSDVTIRRSAPGGRPMMRSIGQSWQPCRPVRSGWTWWNTSMIGGDAICRTAGKRETNHAESYRTHGPSDP